MPTSKAVPTSISPFISALTISIVERSFCSLSIFFFAVTPLRCTTLHRDVIVNMLKITSECCVHIWWHVLHLLLTGKSPSCNVHTLTHSLIHNSFSSIAIRNSSFYYNSPTDFYDSNVSSNSFAHIPRTTTKIPRSTGKWQEGNFVNYPKMIQTLSENCNQFYDDISLIKLKQQQHNRWSYGASAEDEGKGGIQKNIAITTRADYGDPNFDFIAYGSKLTGLTEQGQYSIIAAGVFDDLKEGSDKLLVTFDYGYSDSIEAELSQYLQRDYDNDASATTASIERRMAFAIKEEYNEEYLQKEEEITMESIAVADAKRDERIWAQGKAMEQYNSKDPGRRSLAKCIAAVSGEAMQSEIRDADDDWPFRVHHMQYDLKNDSTQSFSSSFTESEYEVDDSDDDDDDAVDDNFVTELKLKSDCYALERKMLNYINDLEDFNGGTEYCENDANDGNAIEKEVEEEEEFYDSIECT